MARGSRERIITGAVGMLARGGTKHTSVRKLAEQAGTPLGSTYYYFPDGMAQLVNEAVEHAGGQVTSALECALAAGPLRGLSGLIGWWRRILVASEFEEGCPVLSIAVTESRNGPTQQAVESASRVFRQWSEALVDSLVLHGVERDRAEEVATLTVCSIEGSVGVCRAEGSTRALDHVESMLVRAIADALPEEERP
ncbi:TetR family transcriptional regulator [Corynebacterium xerosis]|uniref:TetR family transcriptional regulator n=1 Tax=Corynebacterium xerosis TaxID=1725 RepID=A0A6B8THJ7_9CORY|nr:TetR/AcrR family transcriptional regulator [Corynebacterium xerosis]QGS35134.1 TetR family transcriptional regulator [Corynebacterium xerosis]